MSHLDDRRTTRNRYSEAIGRYLGATGYREPVPVPHGRTRSTTGVVLAGVDETPTSYSAVDHAAVQAELRGWDLRLLHVQHGYEIGAAADEASRRLLEHMAERVRAYSPGVAVSTRVAVGAAAPLLLSDAYNANLLVVGHRHHATGTAFGLSVADRVAAHHTGPVMVVRVPGWPPGPGFGTRPIVVGVDDKTPPAVFEYAVDEARVRGSDLIVLHAVARVTADHEPEESHGVTVHRQYVARDPVAALVGASASASAVVVGRRGPGSFAGALLGSVSRALVQQARCPVFLVG
ncbi:universal stress protein [Pseudosporangium ferrugineum]|uniref:Nucleotide-binding universal stress UspA family protein n=1 Tax=Pseudosporangium ferrugineum TaxID=439699 RepID=A0A2T0SG53_9ACTN|nr:universal stress protein [Pseudosporangium ferrugineum]PRY32404.1 nucleotide-binding universal stress UspA family protein [Pseudosporangium ferrugineum]